MAVETYAADALKKIKGLISDMIAKLEKKAKADAKSENKKLVNLLLIACSGSHTEADATQRTESDKGAGGNHLQEDIQVR